MSIYYIPERESLHRTESNVTKRIMEFKTNFDNDVRKSRAHVLILCDIQNLHRKLHSQFPKKDEGEKKTLKMKSVNELIHRNLK